jgi:hypothetical protein
MRLSAAGTALIFGLLCGLPCGLSCAAQTGAPQTEQPSSLAEAARAARERQKSSGAKKILTNEDLKTAASSADDVEAGTEADARRLLQRQFSKLSYGDINSYLTYGLEQRLKIAQKGPHASYTMWVVPVLVEQLAGDDLGIVTNDVQFPGRAAWQEQLDSVGLKLRDELETAVPQCRAILDKNKPLLAATAPTRDVLEQYEAVRKQFIDILLPAERWAIRAALLIRDGETRASNYLAVAPSARAAYNSSRVAEAERVVGMALNTLRWSENNSKTARGVYDCDPNSDTIRSVYEHRQYDYQLKVVNCSQNHYEALMNAPAADGSQGKGLCVDETDVIRISDDGTTTNCLAGGKPWPLPWVKH